MITGTYYAFVSVAMPIITRPASEGGWDVSLAKASWMGMKADVRILP